MENINTRARMRERGDRQNSLKFGDTELDEMDSDVSRATASLSKALAQFALIDFNRPIELDGDRKTFLLGELLELQSQRIYE